MPEVNNFTSQWLWTSPTDLDDELWRFSILYHFFHHSKRCKRIFWLIIFRCNFCHFLFQPGDPTGQIIIVQINSTENYIDFSETSSRKKVKWLRNVLIFFFFYPALLGITLGIISNRFAEVEIQQSEIEESQRNTYSVLANAFPMYNGLLIDGFTVSSRAFGSCTSTAIFRYYLSPVTTIPTWE